MRAKNLEKLKKSMKNVRRMFTGQKEFEKNLKNTEVELEKNMKEIIITITSIAHIQENYSNNLGKILIKYGYFFCEIFMEMRQNFGKFQENFKEINRKNKKCCEKYRHTFEKNLKLQRKTKENLREIIILWAKILKIGM